MVAKCFDDIALLLSNGGMDCPENGTCKTPLGIPIGLWSPIKRERAPQTAFAESPVWQSLPFLPSTEPRRFTSSALHHRARLPAPLRPRPRPWSVSSTCTPQCVFCCQHLLEHCSGKRGISRSPFYSQLSLESCPLKPTLPRSPTRLGDNLPIFIPSCCRTA